MTIVHLDASGRICSNCGKNHTDEWAKSLQDALFNVPHRYAVLTIPDALWQVVRNDRFLLSLDVCCDCGNQRYNLAQAQKRKTECRCRRCAAPVEVWVTIPHLHILATVGGFDRYDNFIRQAYIPYGVLRKTWQYQVLNRFKKNFRMKMYITRLEPLDA